MGWTKTGSIKGTAGATGSTGSTAAVYSRVGALTVANGTAPIPIPRSCTLSAVAAAVGTAPTGAALNIRINKNGVSAATLSIAATTKTANSTPSVSLALGDVLTVDVTQVGSTVAGSDLGLTLTLS